MKRLTLLTLLLAATLAAPAQERRPRVAVVLSGGGAKGVAHISALRVIEEAGFPIDIVCGTSMGSLIGGLYAIGWTPDELDSLVRNQDWLFLLSDQVNPSTLTLDQRQLQNTFALWRAMGRVDAPNADGGLIRGVNLDRLFRSLCAGYTDSLSFDSLPIPFACVATDIVTGNEVDFRSGHLIQALRSSMAIPGVFTPVRLGDSVLADGGLKNNYPADLARRMGADIVIGVSVQEDHIDADGLTNTIAVLSQIADVNSRNTYWDNILSSDLVIHVPVDGYNAASFYPEAIDTLLLRGDRAARDRWDDLLALRQRHHIPFTPRPASLVHNAEASLATQPSGTPTIQSPIVGAGFRFDNEEAGALILGAMLPFRFHVPMRTDLYVRLGKRILFRAEHRIFPNSALSPELSYTFRRNEADYYVGGSRTLNVKYFHHQADLTPINAHLRRFDLSAGLRWEHFNYYERVLSADASISDFPSAHHLSLRAEMTHNNENHWYFPTRGGSFRVAAAYITENLVTYDDRAGLIDLIGHWRVNIPVASRVTLQPMVYGHLFFGNEVPLPYATVLGNEWFSQCTENQLPFDGVRHIEYVDRHLIAARIQAQVRILKRHYALLRFTVAANFSDFDQLSDPESYANLWGTSLAYFYDSFAGPVGFNIGYSNRLDSPTFYLNIGHQF